MNKQRIKELALANGFKLKEQYDGVLDLNPYVYEFAAAMEEELQAQVERLQNLILEVIDTDADEFFMMGTDWAGAAIASLSETPAQSLAALKARWQAEAVKRVMRECDSYRLQEMPGYGIMVWDIEEILKELDGTQEPTND